MKHKVLTVVLLSLSLLLTACGAPKPENILGRDGVFYTVDPVEMTVTGGAYAYPYQVGGDSITITYPNGSTYTEGRRGITVTVGWSNDYDPKAYTDGEILAEVLWEALDAKGERLPPFLGMLVAALGAWNLLSPETAWYVRRGWWYRNAEPSDLGLAVTRISGGLLLALGVFLLFVRVG